MSLGDMIRLKREEQELTQQEFADLLHVTRQTVSRWENGSRCPDLIMSKKIAAIFAIPLDDLVSSSDADFYVPKKMGASDTKKMLAAIFLLTLAVWFMIYGFASNAIVFAVISMILAFLACFMFVLSYFTDPLNET